MISCNGKQKALLVESLWKLRVIILYAWWGQRRLSFFRIHGEDTGTVSYPPAATCDDSFDGFPGFRMVSERVLGHFLLDFVSFGFLSLL